MDFTSTGRNRAAPEVKRQGPAPDFGASVWVQIQTLQVRGSMEAGRRLIHRFGPDDVILVEHHDLLWLVLVGNDHDKAIIRAPEKVAQSLKVADIHLPLYNKAVGHLDGYTLEIDIPFF